MSIESLIATLLIGGLAGWLAGIAMKGRGFGILGNIVVGIVGAIIGNFSLGLIGVSIGGGFIAALLNAFIGAVILLFLIGLIKKA
jgi:uncharacterized membrane protein YeaQ/YmgE (transglycosylase-associated protein family)